MRANKIKFRNMEHTKFNLICGIVFILSLVLIPRFIVGSRVNDMFHPKDILSFLFIIFISGIIGVLFDSVVYVAKSKSFVKTSQFLRVIFYLITILVTGYLILIIILFSIESAI